MQCHACASPVEPGQRFCGACGASLRNVTDPTAVVPATENEPADAAWSGDDPVWAATGTVPVTKGADAAGVRTGDLPVTEPVAAAGTAGTDRSAGERSLDAVPDLTPDATPAMTATAGVDDDAVWAHAAEGYVPPVDATSQMPLVPTPHFDESSMYQSRVRWSAVTVLSVFMALCALVGSFTVAVTVDTDVRIVSTDSMPAAFRTGTWYLDDFADNLSIAVLIASAAGVIGGVAAAFRWRWGSGLAGGSGLAMAGLGTLAAGLAQLPLQAARDFAATPNPQDFSLTLTTDIGYWLLLTGAGLGLVVFFASLNEAFGDRKPGLNPWIAALGALATVVAVIGPMVPEGTARFGDNLYRDPGFDSSPSLLLFGRLVQLGLLLLAGIVGYLCVRRWGLALVVGGTLPVMWMAVSTLFELTGNPIGPAYRNPGADDNELHGVTVIGVSAILAMTVLALVAAYDQTTRERR
jgi:hypothetical protein